VSPSTVVIVPLSKHSCMCSAAASAAALHVLVVLLCTTWKRRIITPQDLHCGLRLHFNHCAAGLVVCVCLVLGLDVCVGLDMPARMDWQQCGQMGLEGWAWSEGEGFGRQRMALVCCGFRATGVGANQHYVAGCGGYPCMYICAATWHVVAIISLCVSRVAAWGCMWVRRGVHVAALSVSFM
jgi:hypothetical protein